MCNNVNDWEKYYKDVRHFSMIKRRLIVGSLKVMPEIVEAFALYRKNVG